MAKIGVYAGNEQDEVRAFDAWLGREADVVSGYLGKQGWNDFTSSAEWAVNNWEGIDRPILWSVPLFTPLSDLRFAAAGNYNGYYRQVAETLAGAAPEGQPIHIRTAWEFNGGWYNWSAIGREQEFIASWRQFVDTFRSVDDRFVFEWAVNHGDMGMDPAWAYPGDDYVDVIGMDFYYHTDWLPADPDAAWDRLANGIYGLRWHQEFAAAHGKPTAYSEWGVANDTAGPLVAKAAEWFDRYDVEYHVYWNSNADFRGKLSGGQYPNTADAFLDAFAGPPAVVLGTGAADALAGTGRGERLDGLAGPDTMAGGAGDDLYVVRDAGDAVVEAAGQGVDEVRSALPTYTLPDAVENLTLLSTGNQTGIGNALDNRIVGGTGNDVLDGGAGSDRLMGGVGKDTFLIRPGSDRTTIADVESGVGPGDVVRIVGSHLTSSADALARLEAHVRDTVLQLPGGEVIVFANRTPDRFAEDDFVVTGSPEPRPVWDPLAPLEAPTGTTYTYSGNGSPNTLTGTDLNDYMNGGGGADTMAGGRGHDVYVVEHTGDRVIEAAGEGIDRADLWAPSWRLPDHVEHARVLGGGNRTITGNALENRLVGGSGNDVLDGGPGNDLLTGRAGGDTFVFRFGTGHDAVADFARAEGDVIRLDGFGLASFDDLRARLTQHGSDVVLALPGGDTVVLRDAAAASLDAGAFRFTGGTPVLPPVAPSDTLTVTVRASADSWQGDPVMRLFADGRQVGPDTPISVQHGQGWQNALFEVPVDTGALRIAFLNDDWGGSADRDRDLHVDYVDVEGTRFDAAALPYQRASGTAPLGGAETMTHDGSLIVDLGGSSAETVTVTVRASAASWRGDPVMRLFADGIQVGADAPVAVQHGQGWQDVAFQVRADAGELRLAFVNDDWGGSPDRDRDLYVDYVDVDGTRLDAAAAPYERASGTAPLGEAEQMKHDGALVFDLDTLIA